MKRAVIFLSPPLAFVLAATFAWLTGSPVGDTTPTCGNNPRGGRRHEMERGNQDDPSTAILDFERALVLNALPPKQIHDAEWMEGVLATERRTKMIFGSLAGSMHAIECAFDWAEESPEEMFVWLIHQGGSEDGERLSYVSILFEKWAKKDMETALAAVSKIPNPRIRQQAIASTLEILCQRDPTRARDLMIQNLGLISANEDWSPFSSYRTAGTTCELLLSLPPGNERTHLLANLLRGMATGPFEEEMSIAVSTWKQAPEDTRREWVAAGFSSSKENAASFDGLEELARQKAEESGDPVDSKTFIKNHGPAWAKRDLPAALDWAQSHLKGEARVDHGAELFGAAASQDLDATIATWHQLPPGIFKNRASERILNAVPAARKAETEALLNDPTHLDR